MLIIPNLVLRHWVIERYTKLFLLISRKGLSHIESVFVEVLVVVNNSPIEDVAEFVVHVLSVFIRWPDVEVDEHRLEELVRRLLEEIHQHRRDSESSIILANGHGGYMAARLAWIVGLRRAEDVANDLSGVISGRPRELGPLKRVVEVERDAVCLCPLVNVDFAVAPDVFERPGLERNHDVFFTSNVIHLLREDDFMVFFFFSKSFLVFVCLLKKKEKCLEIMSKREKYDVLKYFEIKENSKKYSADFHWNDLHKC